MSKCSTLSQNLIQLVNFSLFAAPAWPHWFYLQRSTPRHIRAKTATKAVVVRVKSIPLLYFWRESHKTVWFCFNWEHGIYKHSTIVMVNLI